MHFTGISGDALAGVASLVLGAPERHSQTSRLQRFCFNDDTMIAGVGHGAQKLRNVFFSIVGFGNHDCIQEEIFEQFSVPMGR